MVTPDEHRKIRFSGQTMVRQHLVGLLEHGQLPPDAIDSYAGGMVEGIRDFVAAYVSDPAAQAMLLQACRAPVPEPDGTIHYVHSEQRR